MASDDIDPRTFKQIGQCKVRRFVAEGGMAWVFEVEHPDNPGVRLALKMLKPGIADPREIERFKREGKILAELNHANLISVRHRGRDALRDCFYYTMEFVPMTLGRWLEKRGRLSLDQVREIFLPLLTGLEALHKLNIVHRDIKPANILMREDPPWPLLGDLGIARALGNPRFTVTLADRTVEIPEGTPEYAAPDQAFGKSTKRSDVFSMGLTLYHALAGRTVYSVIGVDTRDSRSVIRYLDRLWDDKSDLSIKYPSGVSVPGRLHKVIEKACRIRPEDRYADAREMREALRRALGDGGAPFPWWLLLASLGGGVALVSGYVGYKRIMIERAATTRLAEAEALDARAAAALEGCKDLKPPPDRPAREVVDQADRKLEAARGYLAMGRQNVDSGAYGVAIQILDSAMLSDGELCDDLAEFVAGPRARADVERTAGRVEELRGWGVPDLLPERWAELEGACPALEAPAGEPAACAAVEAQLARIGGAAECVAIATRVDAELPQIRTRIVAAARDRAITAQQLTSAHPSTDAHYGAALGSARASLRAGSSAEAAGDHRGALEAYAKAEQSFEQATAIALAANARDDALGLQAQVQSVGGVPDPIRQLLADANQQYAAEAWSAAMQGYREAARGLKEQLTDTQRASTALAAEQGAGAARQRALDEGAERSAAALLAEGDQALERAQAALSAQGYADAEALFQAAESAYGRAAGDAIARLASARASEVKARSARGQLLGDGPCQRLEADQARAECSAAEDALAGGAQALGSRDAPASEASFTTALASLGRASSAEREFQATRPRPPELVKRTPSRDSVEVYRNRTADFSVEARDPNGDPLQYAWSFDASPLQAAGPSFTLRPERSGRLELTVDDGHGGSRSTAWQIALRNRPPELSVSPREAALRLAPGASQDFEAKATDPDGDPVEMVFRLDGRQVQRGSSYRFDAAGSGSHLLEVVATDGGGERAVEERRIDVAPAAKGPEPSAPWEAGARAALERYADALRRKDMASLMDVWMLRPESPYYLRWQSTFKNPDPLEVSVTITRIDKVDEGGNRVTVDFDQREVSPRRTRTYKYRAVLVKRSTTDDWQITENHFEGS